MCKHHYLCAQPHKVVNEHLLSLHPFVAKITALGKVTRNQVHPDTAVKAQMYESIAANLTTTLKTSMRVVSLHPCIHLKSYTAILYGVMCYLSPIQASMFKAGVRNGALPLVYNVSYTSDTSACTCECTVPWY